ncbi:hypothetical protein GUJ93_ZPchr0004g40375 [Zizania palustris]|uniref:RIN4 pathogenic type III effector avirulence factor Avr cleavage site domain-containing protein n=1 Tax=Zizania palustris TaxID=103762 RepID=A0A8J5S296_ZIZPA|nr:hypothetical protein GUJ93_ZPchr0004g40375 [Zizania palustris]
MQNKARPLPKFGEWDVNDPASSEGFSVIFQKARDDKKTAGPGNAKVGIPPAFRDSDDGGGYRPEFKTSGSYQYSPLKLKKLKRVKNRWSICWCRMKRSLQTVPHQKYS